MYSSSNQLNVDAFALPMIGIGMVLRLLGGNSARGALGMALTGFGLFFIGIDVLKDAFEGFVSTLELQRFTVQGVQEVLLFLGIGFLMTVLTQSSSAAWVSLWESLVTFLIEWFPARKQVRLYRQLAASPLSFRQQSSTD